MIREFIFTKPFLNCWNKMGLDDGSLKELEKEKKLLMVEKDKTKCIK